MDNEFKEFIDELLAKTDLVRLISRYLPLNKKGNTHWGCCPFHHEKDPSFAVNELKQFYHCFGCKESGNAISFVQKMESVDFMDAVRMLAEDAKMEIPKFKGSFSADKTEREKRERLCLLMRHCARHYHDNLIKLPQAEIARQYLEKRGVTEALKIKFGLGYSAGGTEIITFLEKQGFTKAEMKEAGLIEQKADSYYDVFYGRLIFPIINNFGDVVAFGGRTLKQDSDFAKYRNSSQTAIFDKSRNIYGINLLKKKKQQSGVKYVIMTEGYMDVIALHKAGFDTAVASMGTALTANQAKMLKNYSNRVYISYDGDTAGQKATMRGLDILADCGLSVRVVSLPKGMDPDDVIKKQGAKAYAQLLEQAQTLTAFKIQTLKNSFDLTDPEGKSKFAVEAIKVVKQLPNPVEQEEYINLIQQYSSYSKQVLMKQAELSENSQPSPIPKASRESDEPHPSNKEERAKRFVAASVINGKDYVDLSDDLYELLDDDVYREIYDALISDLKEYGKARVDSMFTRLSQSAGQKLSNLVDYEFMDGDGKEKYNDCLNQLRLKRIKEETAALNEQAKHASAEQLSIIIKRIEMLNKKANEIKTQSSL